MSELYFDLDVGSMSKKCREYNHSISSHFDTIINGKQLDREHALELKNRFHEITDDYDSIIFNILESLDDINIIKLIVNDSCIIKFIVNPTPEMQAVALKQSYYLSEYINNITESNLIYAICASNGYVFASAPTHCQTVKIIKMMVVKYKGHIEYSMVYPPLLLEPSLKKELEELKIKELGEI